MTAAPKWGRSAAGPDAGSAAPGAGAAPGPPGRWRAWTLQALAVCRLELRRNVAGRRDIPVFLLSMLPVILFALLLFMPTWEKDPLRGPGFAGMLYAGIFQAFMMRFVFFFGCVGIFMNLFRGDLLDRSLHYYFLTPVRREVIVVGKYLSGLVTTSLLFGFSTAATFLLLRARYQMVGPPDQTGAPGLGQLAAYLVVTFLACVGYGSVFLLMGLFFRSPQIPALAILGWESIIFLLPPFLKRISVVYYLQSLCPVQVSGGPIEIIAEPSSPAVAVPGILALTLIALAIAGLRVRRMEVSYATE